MDHNYLRYVLGAVLIEGGLLVGAYLAFLVTQTAYTVIVPLFVLVTVLVWVQSHGPRGVMAGSPTPKRIGEAVLLYCVAIPVGAVLLQVLVLPVVLALLSVLGETAVPVVSPLAEAVHDAWTRAWLTQSLFLLTALYGAVAGLLSLGVRFGWLAVTKYTTVTAG